MRPQKRVEQTVRNKLRFAAGATLHDRLLMEVMRAREESRQTEPARHGPVARRIITRSSITRPASAAAAVAVAALSIILWVKLSTPAYAVGQTVEALRNVRFLHIIGRDEAGQIKDERWIEIGMHGRQVRYRQDNPLALLVALWETGTVPGLNPNDMLLMVPMAVEDGEVTALYRHDKKTVVIYDRKDRQYQWVGLLGEAFENLRQEGKILKENDEYKGRRAHKVWWPYLKAECYVDPETKLPTAVGDTELGYEVPPAGIFDVVTPEGYHVVDTRPGAAGPMPQWLLEEEAAENEREAKGESFKQGAQALARGDYAEAATRLEEAIGYDSWAPFWLGSAYYGLGQYQSAITNFTAVLDLYKKHVPDWPVPYCSYARGLAYAASGNLEAATTDFQTCLPAMVKVLRNPSAGYTFEYADNPMIRYGQHEPGNEESVVKMVNRLRLISGRNFGYDPDGTPEQNEAALAAWEQWFNAGGQIQYTPDVELLPVPGATPQNR